MLIGDDFKREENLAEEVKGRMEQKHTTDKQKQRWGREGRGVHLCV